MQVDKVGELVGGLTVVDVMEVSTQTSRQMKLHEWVDYFNLSPNQRDRILNVAVVLIFR